jgi:hypothetical protein
MYRLDSGLLDRCLSGEINVPLVIDSNFASQPQEIATSGSLFFSNEISRQNQPTAPREYGNCQRLFKRGDAT